MDIFLDQPASPNPIDPKKDRGYKLSFVESALCLITLSGVVYAERHFDRANSLSENFLGLVECCPVLGLAVAAIERMAAAVFKYSNSNNVKTSNLVREIVRSYLTATDQSEDRKGIENTLIEELEKQGLSLTKDLRKIAINTYVQSLVFTSGLDDCKQFHGEIRNRSEKHFPLVNNWNDLIDHYIMDLVVFRSIIRFIAHVEENATKIDKSEPVWKGYIQQQLKDFPKDSIRFEERYSYNFRKYEEIKFKISSMIEDFLAPYLDGKITSQNESTNRKPFIEIIESALIKEGYALEDLKDLAIDIFMDKAILHFKQTLAKVQCDDVYFEAQRSYFKAGGKVKNEASEGKVRYTSEYFDKMDLNDFERAKRNNQMFKNFQKTLRHAVTRDFLIDWNDDVFRERFRKRYKTVENKINYRLGMEKAELTKENKLWASKVKYSSEESEIFYEGQVELANSKWKKRLSIQKRAVGDKKLGAKKDDDHGKNAEKK